MPYLKSFDLNPPGNYWYEMQYNGKRKVWPPQPEIAAQATIVSSFRKGNGLRRASVKECLEDISEFTCRRLGNNPSFCTNSSTPSLALNVSSPIISPCHGCGAPVKA